MLALDYTSASDMWSLGVIVGEMFRGSEFIFGEAEADQFAAIMENIGLPPVQLIERSTRRKVYYGTDIKQFKLFYISLEDSKCKLVSNQSLTCLLTNLMILTNYLNRFNLRVPQRCI